jgi:hypothetical protein
MAFLLGVPISELAVLLLFARELPKNSYAAKATGSFSMIRAEMLAAVEKSTRLMCQNFGLPPQAQNTLIPTSDR